MARDFVNSVGDETEMRRSSQLHETETLQLVVSRPRLRGRDYTPAYSINI